jgi:DNA mismatch repair protein MutS
MASMNAIDTRDAAPNEALTDALADIDPDRLTPREALDALYQLKQLAANNKLQ